MNPTDELASSLSGEQIAQVLRSSGPVVSCVLLRSKQQPNAGAATEDSSKIGRHDENSKESHDSTKKEEEEEETTVGEKRVLEELMEEIQIDTTPKKQMVSQVLGGPFTFLGQYEDEGIVVIVRKYDQDGTVGNEAENDNDDVGEKEDELPLNPHILQPPLHNVQVRGDILLMRVAAVEEGLEEKEDDDEVHYQEDTNDDENTDTDQTSKEEKEDEEKEDSPQDIVDESLNNNSKDQPQQQETTKVETDPKSVETTKFLSNEDFFLDYTKEEYIKFASRTDIVPEPYDENDEEGEESLDDEDYEEEEEDGDYNVESDEEDELDDEECQVGMMNLILAQLLRRFREENGRGPNTSELLTMRSALAAKLGIDERLVNEEYSNDDKRKLESDDQGTEQREKKVKFTNQDEVKIMTDDEALDHGGSSNTNAVEDVM